MSEKRTRISLAQKLDIIEASKKSGFSIEDVMKKYGLKKSTVYRLLAEKEKYTQQEVYGMYKVQENIPILLKAQMLK